MKFSLFNGYLISYGEYSRTSKTFSNIYNYDNLWYIIYFYLLNIFGYDIYKNYSIIPIHYFDTLQSKNIIDILICTLIYNEETHYIMFDAQIYRNLHLILENNSKNNFLYAVLDEEYDLTHEFKKVKNFIFTNKNLKTYEIVNIIQSFFKNKCTVTSESTLKLMTDNSFNEKTYKGKDILIIT
jgi:hypothetical protein